MSENNQEMQVFTPYNVPAEIDDMGDMCNSYLPRITLMHGISKRVTMGEYAPGEWVYDHGDNSMSLGKKVNLIPIALRYTARWTDEADNFKTINTAHYKGNKVFAEAMVLADKGGYTSGYSYGTEFLVWLPDQQSFATLALTSPSARKVSGAISIGLPNKDKAAQLLTLSTKPLMMKKEGKDVTYLAPSVVLCNTPIINYPDAEDVGLVVVKFKAERDDSIESDEEAAEDTTEREV